MDFQITPEQRALREQARKFGAEVVAPRSRRFDEAQQLDMEAWKKAAELGITGFPIPEAYGGSGGDVISYALVMEGLGHGSYDFGFVTSLGAHTVICAIPIWEWGTEDQKRTFLPRLCSGEWIGAYGLTEPNAGSDAQAIETRYEDRGDHVVLNGSKIFITNGPVCEVCIVMATRDRKLRARGISAFIVRKSESPFQVRHLDKMGMRSSPTGELVFEDCVVPKANRLGPEGKGFKVAMSGLGWERACLLAAMYGIWEKRLEDAVAYAQQRVQFGRPIADFQAIQHKLADMKMYLEVGRQYLYKVAWMKQNGLPATLEESILRLFTAEWYRNAALDAFQIHGGYGYMKEYGIERDVRDSIPSHIGAGTSEIQRSIIARLLTA